MGTLSLDLVSRTKPHQSERLSREGRTEREKLLFCVLSLQARSFAILAPLRDKSFISRFELVDENTCAAEKRDALNQSLVTLLRPLLS
ncbi:MAG: hypothetical protein DWQ00_06450 [Candidatus Scalindua sp.]|nr:MAG: hypothetical protein DWQ00_06450 [Candidatus Scalindua sp.]